MAAEWLDSCPFLTGIFNPSNTNVCTDACVPRGEIIIPPFKINMSYRKSCFFHHGVKFCIDSASFWCKTLISSSILMNFRNFMKKWWKIQLLWKLMYMQLIYLKRKVKLFRNWFCGKKVWFLWKNNSKNRIFWFLA